MSNVLESKSPAGAASDRDNYRVDAETLKAIYRTMLRIRAFDNRTIELFNEGLVKGTAHSYVGEEAIASAVCANLDLSDYVGSNHRGHGHCIAKGANLRKMMAELMGRREGYCGGIGGSMHIADLELGILGANGIVGAAMPLCTGAALSAKLRKTGGVAVAFFGDGGANQGVFHESVNLAAIWKLPVIFVCESNGYALTTPLSQTTAGGSVAARAAGYGIPGAEIDGNNPEEVFAVFATAVERARGNQGPSIIEAHTYRWGQHSMRANLADPRPKEEYDSWISRDPVKRIEASILERGILSQEEMAKLDDEVHAEIEDAVDFGKAGAQPTYEAALESVYAPIVATGEEPAEEGSRVLSFTDALNEALFQEMSADESVILMGEDIGPTGGIFQVSKGLYNAFGRERVRDTPISEATFVGCGVGAALTGLRPIVEIQIFDFVTLTMDMIVNQAAKLRFMLGGGPTVPLVIRGPQGGGVRLAAQHSQSLEAWFVHIPGLVVISPSTPFDAKGLLISAIRDNNPVIFLESKLLYVGPGGPVPTQSYAIPIGKGKVHRIGKDVTVVATMAMVLRAIGAADQLAKEGISVEVIDPRTLRPLDEDMILSSVRKTHRLLVVHEAWTRGGFGGEIASLVMEKAFDWLDAPVLRIGAPDMPMPYNDELERKTIPSQARIVEGIRELLA
ncbi:MAG: pyruvate dehydrogenase complex E1 component subunit beta [Roseiarcus sp.]